MYMHLSGSCGVTLSGRAYLPTCLKTTYVQGNTITIGLGLHRRRRHLYIDEP